MALRHSPRAAPDAARVPASRRSMAGPSAASVAALVAAASAPSAPAAAFSALELRVASSPARAAEACRRGAVRAALPHLLDEAHGEDADAASTRDAAIALLATLVAATPQAAAAALGLASCRGCARSRRAMVVAALSHYEVIDLARVPEQARCVAAALVRLCCGATVHESTGDAAARLALALCATPRRHVRDTAVASFITAGLLRSAPAALRAAAGEAEEDETDGEESGALRRAARVARLLAQFVVVAAPPSAKMYYEMLGPHERDKHSTRAVVWDLLCRFCRTPETALPEACASALAASRAPPLLALAGAKCGWAAAPRSARATLSICCAALLAAVCPKHGDEATRVALVLARRPGAFAGLVAGAHALAAVPGHVLSPLPPLLYDEPHPERGSNWKLSSFLHTLFSAVTTEAARSGFDGARLHLFCDAVPARKRGELHAGLSYAVFMAATQPYHDESYHFDTLADSPLRWFSVYNFLCIPSSHFQARPLPAQHPAPFATMTMNHPMTLNAAYAAVATALHEPLRCRSNRLPFGAHELASLAFVSLSPSSTNTVPVFALRCVVYMLGRALRAGSSRDDALASWLLLRSTSTPCYSAKNAAPGTREFLAERGADRREIARAVRIVVRSTLQRLAWVRAAERGDLPNVTALDVADLRVVAAMTGPIYRSTLRQLEMVARQQASSRRDENFRLRRTALRAAAALHALRIVQGDGEPALWQYAAFLPPFAEPSFRASFLPYGRCYFAPPAAAARAAEAAKAAKAAADAAAAAGGAQASLNRPRKIMTLRKVAPPQPPPAAAQLQPRVALLVGDVAFNDVPISRLATSPLLADILDMHMKAVGDGAPLRLSLGADVPPGSEGATFALLLSCLAAVDENAQAAVDNAAADAAADAASAAAAMRHNITGHRIRSSIKHFVLPPQLKAHAAVAFYSWLLSQPCDPPPHRRVDPSLLLPAWSAARHLQLDAVTDALGDALAEWLSRQASDSAAWAAARDALAASPADDELKHALLRADIRALARSHAAVLADCGEGAARDAFAAWHERTRRALFIAISDLPAHRHVEEMCHWASALGRALHAEAALLLPTEAWYGRKITLARRAVRTGRWAVG